MEFIAFFVMLGIGMFIVWQVLIPLAILLVALVVGGIVSLFGGNR